jgi:hypothetical protein
MEAMDVCGAPHEAQQRRPWPGLRSNEVAQNNLRNAIDDYFLMSCATRRASTCPLRCSTISN